VWGVGLSSKVLRTNPFSFPFHSLISSSMRQVDHGLFRVRFLVVKLDDFRLFPGMVSPFLGIFDYVGMGFPFSNGVVLPSLGFSKALRSPYIWKQFILLEGLVLVALDSWVVPVAIFLLSIGLNEIWPSSFLCSWIPLCGAVGGEIVESKEESPG